MCGRRAEAAFNCIKRWKWDLGSGARDGGESGWADSDAVSAERACTRGGNPDCAAAGRGDAKPDRVRRGARDGDAAGRPDRGSCTDACVQGAADAARGGRFEKQYRPP